MDSLRVGWNWPVVRERLTILVIVGTSMDEHLTFFPVWHVVDWYSKFASMLLHLYGNSLGITQCYLQPDSGDIPAFTRAKLVLDLATLEGCKAELTCWQRHICLYDNLLVECDDQGSHASWKFLELRLLSFQDLESPGKWVWSLIVLEI